MKPNSIVIGASTLLVAVVALHAHAQKGMGDAEGVARQTDKPRIVTVSGTVIKVKTDF